MSFMNELRGQRKDAVAVLSRLYASKGSSRIGGNGTTSATTNDILSLTELLITTLSTKGDIDRDVSCRTLTEIVTSLSRFREVEGRISTIIDRLPSLLESYGSSHSQEDGKMDAMSKLLEALLAADSEELIKKINKIVPKLTACAIRLSEKEISASLGLLVLQLLLESRSKTLMIPASSAIKKACLGCLHHTIAAETLALLFSIESPETWQRHWTTGIWTCVRLVQLLGLHMHSSRDNRSHGNDDISLWIVPETMNKLHGYRRALAVERAVGHCSAVLIHMLRNGCATGPTAIDLAALCPLLAYMLALSIDVDDGDARNGVENEQGIAPLHLKIVLPQLKVHLLTILHTLFYTQPFGGLLSTCTALLRPLSAALLSRDCARHVSVFHTALRCFKSAVECFPTAIAREAKVAVAAIVDHFVEQMDLLTAPRSSVLAMNHASGGSTNKQSHHPSTMSSSKQDEQDEEVSSSSSANVELTTSQLTDKIPRQGLETMLLVFEVMETLLLVAGHHLPVATRETIEMAVGQGLAVLAKGVLCVMPSDRHVRRAPAEWLREHPLMQYWLLRVAGTEVLSSTRDGQLSGNIPLLVRACENCLHGAQGSNGMVLSPGTEARRLLLSLSALTHPSAVAMPAIPASVQAKKYLSQSGGMGMGGRHGNSATRGAGTNGGTGRSSGMSGRDENDGIGGQSGEGQGLAVDGSSSSSSSMWRGQEFLSVGPTKTLVALSASSSSSSAVATSSSAQEHGAAGGGGAVLGQKRGREGDGGGSKTVESRDVSSKVATSTTAVMGFGGNSMQQNAAKMAKKVNDDDDDDSLPDIDMEGGPD